MLSVAYMQLFNSRCCAGMDIELWLDFAQEKEQLLHQLFEVHTNWLVTIQLIMH